MIRRIFSTILLLALTIAIVMLAVANRHPVKVSIDPFSTETPAFTAMVPLFLIVLASLIAGAIIGGSAAGPRPRQGRRMARPHQGEMRNPRPRAQGLRDPPPAPEPAGPPPAPPAAPRCP